MKHINGSMEIGKYYLAYNIGAGTIGAGYRRVSIFKYDGIYTYPYNTNTLTTYIERGVKILTTGDVVMESGDQTIFELTDDEIFHNVTMNIITESL